MMKSSNNGTTFEHLSAEEQRLELERAREELLTVKKLLTDRDTELLQLKTAHRKLQDVLRKKDKDLQNVFAVLRAPQDAELTKKRKTELVERLLTETQQRVVNAEAVAEERKRELDKLKYSSKFLRYQELEIELDECYAEIERLRTDLSQFVVVGKLKISRRRVDESSTNYNATTVSKRLVGRRQQQQSSTNVKTTTNQQRSESRERTFAAQDVKPLTAPLTSNAARQGFVDKTRRRAVEAAYNKQLRLAELEAECELEENLGIRAKREAQALAESRRRTHSQQPHAMRIRETQTIQVTTVAVDGIHATAIAPTTADTAASAVQEVHGSAGRGAATQSVSETGAVESEILDTESAAIAIQSAWRAQRLKDTTPATPVVVAGGGGDVVAVAGGDKDAVAKEVRVAETPLPTTQYDGEDDFDHDDVLKDKEEEAEDPESESVVEEDDVVSTRAEIAKSIRIVHHEKEEEDEEEAVVDEDGDIASGKTLKVAPAAVVPVPATREETYETDEKEEEEEEEEEAKEKATEEAKEEGDKPIEAKEEGDKPIVSGEEHVPVLRQGFVVSVDSTGDDSDVPYQPPHQTYTQGFVVEPTYTTSEVLVPDLFVGGNVSKTAPTAEEVASEETKAYGGWEEAVEELETPVASESTLPAHTTPPSPHDALVVAADTPSPRDSLIEEDPTDTTSTGGEKAIHEPVEPTQGSAPVESATIAAETTRNTTAMTTATGEVQDHSDVVPVATVDNSPMDVKTTTASPLLYDDDRPKIPTAEAVLDAVVPTTQEPPNTDVGKTLHACGVAMDAAAETIQRQSQSALVADLALSESESTLPSREEELASSQSEKLTETELAAVMDSAARKIQRFWRDREARYSPLSQLQQEEAGGVDSTPAPPQVEVDVDGVTSNEASGVSTPLAAESAESSPPVSEAETDW